MTSASPKIDFPSFVIGVIKRSIMNQKYNKFENSGHPMQNQYRQQGGYNKFAQQQQQQMAYAQMMNQMAMMQYPPQAYGQYPQPGYPMPQQFPQGQGYNNRGGQGQYNRPQQFGQNPNARPVQLPREAYPVQPPAQKVDKIPFVCNSFDELKANRGAFDALKLEEKQQVYRRLILQKLKAIPDVVKQ